MHYHHQELSGLQQLVNQIGLKYYSPQELLKTVEYSLEIGVPQRAIVDIDWTIFKQLYEARERRTLLKKIDIQLPKPLKQQLGQVGEVLQKLEDTSQSDRYDFLVAYLQSQVAHVLKLKNSQQTTPEKNLTEMGMDSLTAMELKNGVQRNLGIDIPIVKFIEGTTIAALATELNGQLTQGDGEQVRDLLGDTQVSQTGGENSSWIEGEI
jgi:aryl carrier-like protein